METGHWGDLYRPRDNAEDLLIREVIRRWASALGDGWYVSEPSPTDEPGVYEVQINPRRPAAERPKGQTLFTELGRQMQPESGREPWVAARVWIERRETEIRLMFWAPTQWCLYGPSQDDSLQTLGIRREALEEVTHYRA